jgi:hypothetical protein
MKHPQSVEEFHRYFYKHEAAQIHKSLGFALFLAEFAGFTGLLHFF